jgi:hypothetical protein
MRWFAMPPIVNIPERIPKIASACLPHSVVNHSADNLCGLHAQNILA